MLTHTFHAVLRNLRKNRTYALLNIAGLTLAFAVLYMMTQFVYYHLSFDRHVPNVENKYRALLSLTREAGQPTNFATNYFPVGELLMQEQSTVKSYTRLYMLDRHSAVTYDNKPLDQKGVGFTDASFIDFMGLDMRYGTRAALERPSSAIVSTETARIVFGEEDPTGKSFYLDSEDGRYSLTVTGVFADLPVTNHINPRILVSTESLKPIYAANEWRWNFFATYIEFQDQPLSIDFQQEFWSRHFPSYEKTASISMDFQPLLDVHLSGPLTYEYAAIESASVVVAMAIIGLAVLVIALVNYVNLAATKSTSRSRQTGIRKALGSGSWQLRQDALVEAVLIVTTAMILAMTVVQLNPGEKIVGVGYLGDVGLFHNVLFWMANVILLVISVLLCGWYPSQLAAKVKLTSALAGKTKVSTSDVRARRYLVLLQFSLAFIILVGALVVRHQYYYIMEEQQLLNTEQILIVNGPRVIEESSREESSAYYHGLSEITGVTAAAMSTSIPGIWMGTATDVKFLPGGSQEGSTIQVYGANEGYLDVYGIELLHGRNFSESLTSDARTVLINESALKKLGVGEAQDVLDKTLRMGTREWKIIGVVKDYHHASMKQEIPPIIIRYRDFDVDYFSLTLSGDFEAKSRTIEILKARWNEFYPPNPFDYYFHDTLFDQIYKSEQQAQTLISFLSAIAMILASMGLVGLMSEVVFQKQKEIGIRKTLGANFMQITTALSQDTFKIMLIAFGLSIPAALFLVRSWLDNYAYHISASWYHFVIPVVVITLISAVSVAGIMLRASRINPVDILRNE